MPEQPEPWQIVFFKRHPDDDPRESRPGKVFLAACPKKVAQKLGNILRAVAAAPPPQFQGGGTWEAMHDTMRGYYEARTRGPEKRLYRLYCLLERPRPGLQRSAIVIIGGMWKLNETGFTDAEYAAIRRLGDEYRARTPRSVAP